MGCKKRSQDKEGKVAGITDGVRRDILRQCMDRLSKIKVGGNPPKGYVLADYVAQKLEVSKSWISRNKQGLKAVQIHHSKSGDWYFDKSFIDRLAILKCQLEAQAMRAQASK